jgi:hypothetical protein
MNKILILAFVFSSSCAWNSEEGRSSSPYNEETHTARMNRNRAHIGCVGENEFGKFVKGAGCNVYGCWNDGGSCNENGCSADSICTAFSCPKKIDSIQCAENNQSFFYGLISLD